MSAIEISLEGEDAVAETGRLYRWLRDDPDVFYSTELELKSSPAPEGAMGGTLEYINLIINSTSAVAALITALTSWHQTRRRKPLRLRIKRNGQTYVLDNVSPEDLHDLLDGAGGHSPSDDTGDRALPDRTDGEEDDGGVR